MRVTWTAVVDGERLPELDIMVQTDHEGGSITPQQTARILCAELVDAASWELPPVLARVVNNRRG